MAAAVSQNYQSILAKASDVQEDAPGIILVYGEGGLGKTTFAAGSPRPIFLCTEDGAKRVKGAKRLPADGSIQSWAELLDYTRAIAYGEHNYGTIVADTADCADALCVASLVKDSGKLSFEKMGWGKDEALAAKWREWLSLLEHCRNVRGMTVILIAHAIARSINSPTIGQYSGYSGKMNKTLWGVTYNWVDVALFAELERVLHEPDQGKARGIVSGDRFLHTKPGTGFDAKQRAGYHLPAKLPLSWSAFADALKAGDETADVVRERIAQLVLQSPEDAAKAESYVKEAGDDAVKLRSVENALQQKLKEKKS